MNCTTNPGLIQMFQDYTPSLSGGLFLGYCAVAALVTARFLAPIIIGAWRGE